jgi:hypothetical protein
MLSVKYKGIGAPERPFDAARGVDVVKQTVRVKDADDRVSIISKLNITLDRDGFA